MGRPLADLQKAIAYSFRDEKLLRTALTHTSAGEAENYERLEFLGDRVLGLVIADYIFKKFPEEKEGALARRLASLVQGETLADLARDLDLGKYIQLSASEQDAGGAHNTNILADSMEALIGALYLDGGLEPCRNVIEKRWAGILHTMKKPPQHPKTQLQEWAQSLNLPLPDYQITRQSGPDHAPLFDVQLSLEGYETVKAQGRSRQEAEKRAAETFLEINKIASS